MDSSKGAGYDFNTNLNVKGKDKYVKDITEAMKAASKFNDASLRAASQSQYKKESKASTTKNLDSKQRLREAELITRARKLGLLNEKKYQEEYFKDRESFIEKLGNKLYRKEEEERLHAARVRRRNVFKEHLHEVSLAKNREAIDKSINERGFLGKQRWFRQMTVATTRHSHYLKESWEHAKKLNIFNNRLFGGWISHVIQLGAAYMGLRSIISQVNKLMEVGNKEEQLVYRNRVFFGNDKNTENMLAMVRGKINSGQMAGNVEEVTRGMVNLQEKGIDAQKNFQVIADMAGRTGHSFEEATQSIQEAIGGSETAFQKFGIQAIEFRRITRMYKPETKEMRAAVMSFIQGQKQFKGGAKEYANTFEGFKMRAKSWVETFRLAVIGDAKDSTSLMFAIKRTFGKISDFVNKHKAELKAIAHRVSEILKWLWTQIDHIFDKIMGSIGKMDLKKFEQGTMRIITWLEFMKVRAKAFFKEWGGFFFESAKWLLALKGFTMLASPLLKLVDAFKALKLATAFLIDNPALMAVVAALGLSYKLYEDIKNEGAASAINKRNSTLLGVKSNSMFNGGANTAFINPYTGLAGSQVNVDYSDPLGRDVIAMNAAKKKGWATLGAGDASTLSGIKTVDLQAIINDLNTPEGFSKNSEVYKQLGNALSNPRYSEPVTIKMGENTWHINIGGDVSHDEITSTEIADRFHKIYTEAAKKFKRNL